MEAIITEPLITEEMARIPGSVRKAGGTNGHPPDR
jgi:hypothetical protein